MQFEYIYMSILLASHCFRNVFATAKWKAPRYTENYQNDLSWIFAKKI